MATYKQFKNLVNRALPDGNNHFCIGGNLLYKSDLAKLDDLPVTEYGVEYIDNENGDCERLFCVTAREES